jgi:hypothetical protein
MSAPCESQVLDEEMHNETKPTVEEMRQASMALIWSWSPPSPRTSQKGRVAPAVADRGPH